MLDIREIRSITTLQELRAALGGDPTSGVANRIRTQLAPVDRRWLAASNFCWMATSDADGTLDVSPRGDERGFVFVLDERTIVLPERAGNKRGDGYRNLLQNPNVGLNFLVPPRSDTLRISGGAVMISEAPWFDQLAVDGALPVLAIVVTIKKVFYHCPKAFHRARFWRRENWQPTLAPSRTEIAGELDCDA